MGDTEPVGPPVPVKSALQTLPVTRVSLWEVPVATGTSQSDTLVTGNVWRADFTGTGGPTGSVSPIYQLLLSD